VEHFIKQDHEINEFEVFAFALRKEADRIRFNIESFSITATCASIYDDRSENLKWMH
jgi:hypothetical protein